MSARPINVLMLAPRIFEPPHLGGGERYVSELCASLRERDDIQFNLWTFAFPASIRRRHPVGGPGSGIRGLIGAALGADLIHAHQINSPAFDLAVVLATATATPLVLTDLGGGWATPGRLLGRERLRLVTGLAPISAASEADLGWAPGRPIRILYGGGEHVLNGSRAVSLRHTDFLYVGRLLPHKGVDLLIEALPRDRSLRICGSVAEPDFLSRLEQLASGKDIEFVMNPGDDELAELYRASSFSVLPSQREVDGKPVKRAELLGLVLLESLACGTPCLGSDIPAVREILRPVDMPLFEPGDARILAKTMAALPLRGSSEHRRYVGLCRSAASRYSWRQTANRAVEFYGELLAESAR